MYPTHCLVCTFFFLNTYFGENHILVCIVQLLECASEVNPYVCIPSFQHLTNALLLVYSLHRWISHALTGPRKTSMKGEVCW